MNVSTVLWYAAFCGFAVDYMARTSINIAIVSMVKPPEAQTDLSRVSHCYNYTLQRERELRWFSSRQQAYTRKLFDWDEYSQSQVLGAYFWLHWATPLMGGILAHHYGAKYVFGVSILFELLLCFTIPSAAYLGDKMLMAVRVLQGLFSGVLWPSMHILVSKWVPSEDRSRFTSAYLGSSVGASITYFGGGFIIDYFGWERLFYVIGTVGIAWYAAWYCLVCESPDVHTGISKQEKAYIISRTGNTSNENKLPVPWRKILMSSSVWLTILAQWGALWNLITLITHAPTYLKAIHGLDVKLIGTFSALPYLIRWMFSYIFALYADLLIRHNLTSKTNVRKLATALCTVMQALFLVWLAFVGCDVVMAIIALMIAITLQGAISSGPLVALIDLSPNYSGILQGIAGTFGTTPGIISPILIGVLTEHNQTVAQWQKVFLTSAAVLFSTGSIYLCFGSSEVQIWDSEDPREKEPLLPGRSTDERPANRNEQQGLRNP